MLTSEDRENLERRGQLIVMYKIAHWLLLKQVQARKQWEDCFQSDERKSQQLSIKKEKHHLINAIQDHSLLADQF